MIVVNKSVVYNVEVLYAGEEGIIMLLTNEIIKL